MKKRKESIAIYEFFIAMFVAVFSVLVLCAIFGIPYSDEVIWSSKGFGVMFGVAIVQIAIQVIFFHRKIKTNFFMKCCIILAIIYVLGILLGTFVMKELGFDATMTPMWSNAGAAICYWIALISWFSSKVLLRKTL